MVEGPIPGPGPEQDDDFDVIPPGTIHQTEGGSRQNVDEAQPDENERPELTVVDAEVNRHEEAVEHDFRPREPEETPPSEEELLEYLKELNRLADEKILVTDLGRELHAFIDEQEKRLAESRPKRLREYFGKKGAEYRDANKHARIARHRMESWRNQEVEQIREADKAIELQKDWFESSENGGEQGLTSKETRRKHKALKKQLLKMDAAHAKKEAWLGRKVKEGMEFESEVPIVPDTRGDQVSQDQILERMSEQYLAKAIEYIMEMNTNADSELDTSIRETLQKTFGIDNPNRIFNTNSAEILFQPNTAGIEMAKSYLKDFAEGVKVIFGKNAQLTGDELKQFIAENAQGAIKDFAKALARNEFVKEDLRSMAETESKDYNPRLVAKTIGDYLSSNRDARAGRVGIKKEFHRFTYRKTVKGAWEETRKAIKTNVGGLVNTQLDVSYDTRVSDIISHGQNELASGLKGLEAAGHGLGLAGRGVKTNVYRVEGWTVRGLRKLFSQNEGLRDWEVNWHDRRDHAAAEVGAKAEVCQIALNEFVSVVSGTWREGKERYRFENIKNSIRNHPQKVKENFVGVAREYTEAVRQIQELITRIRRRVG